MEEERWKKIEGYDNYEISSMGNIKNTKTYKLLKSKTTKNKKYPFIILSKNNIQICNLEWTEKQQQPKK